MDDFFHLGRGGPPRELAAQFFTAVRPPAEKTESLVVKGSVHTRSDEATIPCMRSLMSSGAVAF